MLSKILGKFFDIRRYYFYYYLLRYQILGNPSNSKKRKLCFPGIKVWCYDPRSVAWQYKEIAIDKCYEISNLNKDVTIVDCGANIGLSIISFSRKFPQHNIIAFEANPQIAELLKENLRINKVTNCTVHEKAVWVDDAGVRMSITPDDASSVSVHDENTVVIPSVDFRKFLQEHSSPILLKMDIEGAEMRVIPQCDGAMKSVQHIFMEYHAYYDQPQDLDILLAVLSENNFRYTISRPYVFNDRSQAVEFVLNLTATR